MARDNPRGSCAAASGVSPARRGFRPNIAGVAADGVIAETDRVILRQWRLDEADRFFDMHRRMEVARWIDGRPMADRAEAEPVIQRMLDRLAVDPRFGCWAVAERASRVPAGSVVLEPLPDGAGEIEIGWHLHPDSWGRGLATEAARALLTRGFAFELEEIWAVTHPDNRRSARVCQKLGDATARHHAPVVPRAFADVLDRRPRRSAADSRPRSSRTGLTVRSRCARSNCGFVADHGVGWQLPL